VLKKLTAAGFLAATTTGVLLSSGPANADLLAAHRAEVPATHPADGCYYNQPVYYQPAWCATTPPVTVAPPITVYPGYPGYHYGWGRWHHRNYWPGRVYFRR
jgi:hypothetical protein